MGSVHYHVSKKKSTSVSIIFDLGVCNTICKDNLNSNPNDTNTEFTRFLENSLQ
jgi:hypothetical protein